MCEPTKLTLCNQPRVRRCDNPYINYFNCYHWKHDVDHGIERSRRRADNNQLKVTYAVPDDTDDVCRRKRRRRRKECSQHISRWQRYHSADIYDDDDDDDDYDNICYCCNSTHCHSKQTFTSDCESMFNKKIQDILTYSPESMFLRKMKELSSQSNTDVDNKQPTEHVCPKFCCKEHVVCDSQKQELTKLCKGCNRPLSNKRSCNQEVLNRVAGYKDEFDYCERCWRYEIEPTAPVNKPHQRYDPNLRNRSISSGSRSTSRSASRSPATSDRTNKHFSTSKTYSRSPQKRTSPRRHQSPPRSLQSGSSSGGRKKLNGVNSARDKTPERCENPTCKCDNSNKAKKKPRRQGSRSPDRRPTTRFKTPDKVSCDCWSSEDKKRSPKLLQRPKQRKPSSRSSSPEKSSGGDVDANRSKSFGKDHKVADACLCGIVRDVPPGQNYPDLCLCKIVSSQLKTEEAEAKKRSLSTGLKKLSRSPVVQTRISPRGQTLPTAMRPGTGMKSRVVRYNKKKENISPEMTRRTKSAGQRKPWDSSTKLTRTPSQDKPKTVFVEKTKKKMKKSVNKLNGKNDKHCDCCVRCSCQDVGTQYEDQECDCQHKYLVNERLFAVPVVTNTDDISCCVKCNKPDTCPCGSCYYSCKTANYKDKSIRWDEKQETPRKEQADNIKQLYQQKISRDDKPNVARLDRVDLVLKEIQAEDKLVGRPTKNISDKRGKKLCSFRSKTLKPVQTDSMALRFQKGVY